ncbi:hypothetical protein LXA43DRAFT_1186573 [Ganoderma leucocontextum]|nr:hypothetical protein LXA43DRAFT_1186573 [Ganoderma leucocontextum]
MSTSTQLAISSAEQCSPWIPPELISLILVDLWEALEPTPQDRSALLKNIALVNRTWLALIARIASHDVHISNVRNGNAFLRLLPERSPLVRYGTVDLFSMEAHQVAKQLCRSLTFHLDRSVQPPLSPELEHIRGCDRAVSLVLSTVRTIYSLPNLRRISLRYTDWGYNYIFRQIQWQWGHSFPEQVTHLSLDYSFTATAAARAELRAFDLSVAMRWIYSTSFTGRRAVLAVLPNVQHLSLSGVPTPFVAAMLHVCPNVETLEITNPTQLAELAPLPPAVRTLVLRHPGVTVPSEKTIASWTLSTALEGGLFPEGEGTKPRIVVRSGTPDPESFIELRRSCKRFDVDLVHERDDDARSPSC